MWRTVVLASTCFLCAAASAAEWRGLSRTSFFDAAERQRTEQLLDLLDKHLQEFPGYPGPTALFLLLKGDPESVAQANKMITVDGKFTDGHGQEPLWLLRAFGDQLTPEARTRIEQSLREAIQPGRWQWTRSTKFYNINWPLTACEILIVGGEAVGDEAAVKHGTAKLQEILDGITGKRLGTVSEFNSPTYYGADLTAMAGLAHLGRDEAVRIKATLLEERLWLDLATRYHPGVGQVAGPYSRVYHDGLVGGTGIAGNQIYKVFDAGITTDFRVSLEYPHYWDLGWTPMLAFQPYHCPDYIRQIAMDKSFPYEVRGVSAGDEFRGYPFCYTDLHTYLSPKWALASNSRYWLDGGQNAACIAHWGKRFPVRGMRDFKVAYSRYVINDAGPDVASLNQPAMGRISTLQEGGTVLTLYKPKAAHARPKEINEGGIRSLRLDLQIPLYDDVDELAVGYRNIHPSQPDVATGWDNRVYLRDGDVFLGVRPLEPTNLGAERPLRVRRHNEFLLISLYNLDVPDYRQIPDEEIHRVKNGFVLEMGDTAQFPNLDSFRRHCEAGKVSEEPLTAEGERSVRYANGERSLLLKYNMVSEESLEREVNGNAVAYPLFQCDNAVITDLPSGEVRLGDATLRAEAGTYVWLLNNPQRTTHAAYNFSEKVVPLSLSVPAGEVKVAGLGFGKVVAREKGQPGLEVWAVTCEGPISFPRKLGEQVMLNGKDVTQQLRATRVDGCEMLQLP